MGQPRRKAERLHARQTQTRPARRSAEGAPRIKEPADTAAEASLRQAEQIFQAIFDNTSDGIFLLDLEARRFTMCNQSCLQMLGYTREEFADLSIADLHPPADLPFIHAQIEEFLRGGKPIRHDIRFKRKDGGIVFTDLSSSLVVLDGRRYILVALKDITERKRMEEELRQHAEHLEELVAARTGELRESEARYRGLYHTIADGIFVMGAEGRIEDVNDSACAQLGYAREELIGLPVAAISARPDFQLGEILDRLRAAGNLSYETAHRRKDGSIIPVELSVALIEYRGRPAILGVARDISERKQAEAALRESEAGLAAAQRLVHLGSWQWDIATDTARWSDETFRIFGIARGLLQQHREDFLSRIVPEDRQRVDQALADALSGTRDYDLDYRIRLPDGRERVIHAQAQVSRSSDGRPVTMHGTVHDVTERKQAEDALRASEERFRTMADQAPVMIGVTNEKGEITFLNKAWLDLRGKTLEEEAGWSWADEVHPEDRDRVVSAIRSAIERGDRYSLEYRIRDRLGNYRWVLDTAAPLLGPEGESRGYIGTALDITERKQAEEALAESRKRYCGLVEKINDWVWEVDADGVYTYASPRARELLGYAPEEIVGKTPFDFMPPDEAERVRNAFWPICRARKPLELLENTLVRKDGRLVTVETSGMPVFAEDGSFRGYTGIDRDVTSRKQAEEALREKEYLLSESQRIGHIGTWSADPVTNTGTWTPEMYRLFGVSPDTFVPTADTFLSLLHPDDRGAMREWMRAALAGEHPGGLEVRVPLADGSVRVLIGRGEAIFAADHRPVRLVGTAQDVTEQKRAEEALRESEQRYRRLVENLKGSHFVYRHDTTGMLTYVSESVTEVLGYTLDEGPSHYGKYFTDHPANRAAHRHTELTLQGIRQPPYEVNVWHKDGSRRWLEVQEVPVFDAAGQVVAVEGVAQDITERKQAEEALRRMNEQLELQVAQRTEDLRHTVDRLRQLTLELSQAEDRERKRIADILHEDVQQTLAAARFHLNLLDSEARSVEESRDIIERVKRMLRDAIERSRRLSHELSPTLYQVELTEILDWLARHMRQEHGLNVRVVARGPVDSSSEPLKAFLYKVIQELLFNVVKHAGVSEARVRVRRMGRNICLSVVDTGKGFDPERLEGTGGFGLLSIRERVQLLGGRMKIWSRPGRGSRFLIVVPDQGSSAIALAAEYSHEQAQPGAPTQRQPAEES